jgi:glycosyltransferase involved in cell wall biosynthesis
MKKELSILLITYNRKKRLEKTFPEIISNKSDKIEFVVIDNNSTDDTETYIKHHSEVDSRIRYFKNFRNLGPNRTLYRGILESEANWVTIVTDDDLFPKEFFDEILAEIDKGCNCGLIITAKKNQKPLYDKTRIINGIDALKTAYLHTSAIPGITWNKDYIEEPKWLLDGYIYSQVRISSNISLKSDVMYLVPKHKLEILNWDEDKLFSLPRPKDFGIFELINLLDDLKYKNYIDGINNFYYSSSAARFAWISNVFDEMIDESPEMSKDFFKILVRHKSIKSSIIFWIIFFKNHFKKRSLRFLLLKSLIYGIITSITNMNLYGGIYFLILNFSDYKSKYYKLNINND